MQSYQLHLAIVAIACVALQVVDCGKGGKNNFVDVETYLNSEEMKETEHHDCTNYKSNIWNTVFGNPNTMHLTEVALSETVKMAANPVCSDTIRSVLNFVSVMATDNNAHNAIGGFLKLVKTAAKQAEDPSAEFNETLQVIHRIRKSPKLLEMAGFTVDRSVQLLRDQPMRNRLVKLFKALKTALNTSGNEEKANNSPFSKVSGVVVNNTSRMAKGAMQKVGKMIR